MEAVRANQGEDWICKQVAVYCQDGWPTKSNVHASLKPLCSVAGELSVQDGLLMRGSHVVIPTSLRAEVLAQLHAGHQGISNSCQRARQSVWWPGMSADLEKMVRSCSECAKHRSPRPKPLLSTPMPTLPWQRIGTDLFEWKGAKYLLLIDYFSRWIEIARLEQATSSCVIGHMLYLPDMAYQMSLYPTVVPNIARECFHNSLETMVSSILRPALITLKLMGSPKELLKLSWPCSKRQKIHTWLS